MSLLILTPQAAEIMISRGALLVDIRKADEFARERIGGARNLQVQEIENGALTLTEDQKVIFYCRWGNRTRLNARKLVACVPGEAYMLAGGIEAWKDARLSTDVDPSQPLELQRQVLIAAGLLVVLGYVLGVTVTPWAHLLSGLVGCGMIFSGITGICGMATVLMLMPWNRRAMSVTVKSRAADIEDVDPSVRSEA